MARAKALTATIQAQETACVHRRFSAVAETPTANAFPFQTRERLCCPLARGDMHVATNVATHPGTKGYGRLEWSVGAA
jgi:hypothetical protein